MAGGVAEDRLAVGRVIEAPQLGPGRPAARRDLGWTRGVAALLLFGLFVVATLWACFLLDYGTTRQVYFTVAMLHVLAEVPFLLRLL